MLNPDQNPPRVDPEKTYKVGQYTITHGKFTGDVEKTLEFFERFLRDNQVVYEGFGHGYGTLTINDGRVVNLNPYGIDIEMMISNIAGGKIEDFAIAGNRQA